jgi:glycosyltransferase involved in cell wall biosynthesis
MNAANPAGPVVWVLVRELSRTGVPIVLARMLRARRPGGAVHVVALRGGPLERRVAATAASCTTLEPVGRRSVSDAAAVGMSLLGARSAGDVIHRAAWSRRMRRLPRPDVVVVHGAGAWPLVALAPPTTPVVLHLHELAIGLDRCIPPAGQPQAFARASKVLAVSGPVADLAVHRGARPGLVELLPGAVEIDSVAAVPHLRSAPSPRRVMGAGSPGWRKATDRVTAVAHELARSGHGEVVGWMGGAPSGPDSRVVAASDPVRWYPATEDPWATMAGAEVVLVPSREDPLPLVALEAGLHARAVVATPTGGLPDLLADGRGAVAPGHDVAWLARTTARLLEDPDERQAMGDALRTEVVRSHDARVVASQWWDVISDVA